MGYETRYRTFHPGESKVIGAIFDKKANVLKEQASNLERIRSVLNGSRMGYSKINIWILLRKDRKICLLLHKRSECAVGRSMRLPLLKDIQFMYRMKININAEK